MTSTGGRFVGVGVGVGSVGVGVGTGVGVGVGVGVPVGVGVGVPHATTDKAKVCATCSTPSHTTTLTMYVSAALNGIVPIISPVWVFSARPGGRIIAEKTSESPSGSLATSRRETVSPSQDV